MISKIEIIDEFTTEIGVTSKRVVVQTPARAHSLAADTFSFIPRLLSEL